MRLLLAVVFGWIIWSIWKRTFMKKNNKQPEPRQVASGEMIACRSCGTFVLLSEALESRGERFCSLNCANKS